MKVVLLPQAQKNLDDIHEPLYSHLVRAFRLLERSPQLGAAMAGPFTGYRSLVVGLFRVVYRVAPNDTVEIAYLRHCRRAPPA